MYFQKKVHISIKSCFHFNCWHIAQYMYHRFRVLPSYGIAARWVVPAHAGCSPRSFLFASSGWHPGERAVATAACAPHPGRRACWYPILQTTKEHQSFSVRNRMNSFEAAAFFGLLFLCIALHNAHKICTTLISLMAFNVILYENIAEIKLSSQSFSHTFQCYCCPAQFVKEVRASSAYKWVIFDYKITYFFSWWHFHTEHFFSADCLYPSPKGLSHNLNPKV